MPRGPAGET